MPRVNADTLRAYVRDIYTAHGLSAEAAETLAEVQVWADLRGIGSHGVSRVATYLGLVEKGLVNLDPAITVDSSRPGVALVDADRAPGPVALTIAADEAIRRARENGVAWVAVRETVHTGAIGYYTNRIAEEGLIGIGMVAGMPNMGYTGAAGASVATSPLSIAVPGTGKYPTPLLDMATAVIALGKIAQAKKSGTPLPDNAAMTEDGTVTTDPELATIPLPMSGPKGSGMSLMFELLTSVLVGAPILTPYHREGNKKHRQNASILALDPTAFGDEFTFGGSVDNAIEVIHGLPKAPGVDAVLVPGDRGARSEANLLADGIELRPALWDELAAAAALKGVAVPETRG